jgi:acyl dehydratase
LAIEVDVSPARSAPDLDVLAGLEFPIVTYEVSREKIGEYVAAIGDRNPLHRDPVAAQAAGYRDVIAPPTFAAVFAMLPFRRALADVEWVARSTIDPAKILHGEQSFEFSRPIMPGDRLLVQCIVRNAERKKDLTFLYVSMRVDNERGERMLDGTMTLVLRP